MKGITISERYKEKDAYDIYALLAHYKNGPNSCIEEIGLYLENKLIEEGIQSICEKFAFENSVGPTWAAKFIEPTNPKAARVLQADIYRRVYPFIEEIKSYEKRY